MLCLPLGKLLVFLANVRLDCKVIASYKHSGLFGLINSDEGKKFYYIDPRVQRSCRLNLHMASPGLPHATHSCAKMNGVELASGFIKLISSSSLSLPQNKLECSAPGLSNSCS